MAKLEPPLPAATTLYPKEESTDVGALDVEHKTNTDNLRIKGVLSRWCVENSQAHALLQCELAQVDNRHTHQTKMIEAAKKFVIESENSEAVLKAGQGDLTVMTSSDSKAPIIWGAVIHSSTPYPWVVRNTKAAPSTTACLRKKIIMAHS